MACLTAILSLIIRYSSNNVIVECNYYRLNRIICLNSKKFIYIVTVVSCTFDSGIAYVLA